MKIVCSVAVGNRLLPTLAINSKQKHVKSTLALCKIPKSDDSCIILFSSQNKNGTKYHIKNNITKILTKFINEGKATIQFKAPPHDLFVKSDAIQLKSFLHLLKRVLENKITEKELTLSSMAVTPISTKDVAPKKLVIKARGDYPTRGFPRTLELLYINDIKRCALDKGILNLVKLKILDLSNNLIEFIPQELNKLRLTELYLGSNQMGKSPPKQWGWMGGNLSHSLLLLNMEKNSLKYLPDQIVKLHNLATLVVRENLLTYLPTGVGNLRALKNLDLSRNLLKILPGSIKKCNLQLLQFGDNEFEAVRPENRQPASKTLPVLSLKDIAARVVLESKFPYTPATIPFTLVDYLDYAKYCVCGKACFSTHIRVSEMLSVQNIALCFSASSRQSSFLPIDSYFCSLSCYRNSSAARKRNQVI